MFIPSGKMVRSLWPFFQTHLGYTHKVYGKETLGPLTKGSGGIVPSRNILRHFLVVFLNHKKEREERE